MSAAPLSIKRKREEAMAKAHMGKTSKLEESATPSTSFDDTDYHTISSIEDLTSPIFNDSGSKDSELENTWDGQIETSTPNSKANENQQVINMIFFIILTVLLQQQIIY